jgi:glucose-6-phosphate isomerase
MRKLVAGVPLAVLEARSSGLPSCPAWCQLTDHAASLAAVPLNDLLDVPGRYQRMSRSAAGLHLDFSRQRLAEGTLPLLLQLAGERNLADWTEHLFAGSLVNATEARPALHMALRSRRAEPLMVNGADIRPVIRLESERMLGLSDRVSQGDYRGHTGKPITDVINIGIGGSDLGLVMATEALRAWRNPALRVHFVSNIDGLDLATALESVDADRTLFIICSKSFVTIETKLNAEAARAWFLERMPETALARHFFAVSVNDSAMDRFGVSRENRFRIWDWVGGRYSLWSSVGMAIAMAIGSGNFRAMLDGAGALDEHFRGASPAENLPVLLALIGIWNQNFLGTTSHAVLPYTHRLHRLPAFLQQLEMESNGKSVTRDGRPVAWKTGTVIWGEPGSNAQHAFFQLLHQGTEAFSADFIAPARAAGGRAGQHLAGLANMLAQAEAFARGRTEEQALAEMISGGMPEARARSLAPHKVHPGGHPSTLIMLEALDPAGLGALIALYEHKVFVQSVIWGVNPFDQWGVELGKTMASGFSDALAAAVEPAALPLPGIAALIRAAQDGQGRN